MEALNLLVATLGVLLGIYGQGPCRVAALAASGILLLVVAWHLLGGPLRLSPWIGLIAVSGIFTWAWTSGYNIVAANQESSRLSFEQAQRRLIEKANDAEFKSYRDLPNIHLSRLRGFFVEGELAYNRIKHLLEVHAARGWVLDKNSFRKLISIDVIGPTNKESTTVHIKTREQWSLTWIDSKTGKVAKTFERTFDQTYETWLVDGTWLVYSNTY